MDIAASMFHHYDEGVLSALEYSVACHMCYLPPKAWINRPIEQVTGSIRKLFISMWGCVPGESTFGIQVRGRRRKLRTWLSYSIRFQKLIYNFWSKCLNDLYKRFWFRDFNPFYVRAFLTQVFLTNWL